MDIIKEPDFAEANTVIKRKFQSLNAKEKLKPKRRQVTHQSADRAFASFHLEV